MLIPLLDPLARTWPMRLGEAGWRFGTLGLLFNSLVTPLLGLALALGVALVLDQRRVLRGLAVVAGLAGLAILLSLVAFGLDAIELRHGVAPQALDAFQTTVVKAGLAALLAALAALGLAIGSWRTGRRSSSPRGARADRLVMSPADTK